MIKKIELFWRNLIFRKKLALSYLLAIIVPIVVMGLFSFHISKNNLYRQAIQGYENYNKQLIQEVNTYFQRYELNLNQIAVDYRVQSAILTRAASDYALLTLVNGYFEPLIYNISMLDEYVHQVLVYTNCKRYPSVLIKDVSLVAEEPWYLNQGENSSVKWYITDDYIYGSRNILELNSRGQKLGTICMKVYYQKLFHSFLFDNNFNQGILLQDRNGECLFLKKTNREADNTIVSLLNNVKNQEIMIDHDNYLLLSYPLGNTEYQIHFYMAYNDLIIDTSNIFLTLIPVILCCFFSIFLIMQIFSRSFTRPIEQLNQKIQEVSQCNFEINVHSKYNDEIGQLTNQFAYMVQKINQLITQVYQAEILKKDAQLQTLQAQINPHFLYNAFSVINWKAIETDNLEISYFVLELSKFYRTTLNSGQTQLPISKVIENIKAYINICLIMYNHSFDTEYYISESLYDISILNLLLQPIVENAIEHGIRKVRNRRGKIIIRAWEEDNYVYLEVKDNGIGMTSDQIENILNINKSGYALKNINKRIKIYYGDDCGIHFQSVPDRYTIVQLKLKK